jgi:ATP-dependent DNA helicase RecG
VILAVQASGQDEATSHKQSEVFDEISGLASENDESQRQVMGRPPPSHPRHLAEPSPAAPAALQADVASVTGVGPRRSAALHAQQIVTLADALMHLPYRYEDLRRRDKIEDLKPGMDAVVEGILLNIADRPMPGRWSRRLATAFLKQSSGKGIRVVWFNLRSANLPGGEPLALSGRVSSTPDGTLEMVHPEIYRLRTAGVPAIRPIYSLPAEVSQRLFASIAQQALQRSTNAELDAIPPELATEIKVLSVVESLSYLHRPPIDANLDELQTGATPAHRALALHEMFTFQLALAREHARMRTRTGAPLNGPPRMSAEMLDGLPFTLTSSQLRAIDEISSDLVGTSQMNRILIGDVGSGKTLVAFHAALRAAESGWQAAIMAPTELLAEQHFSNFTRITARLGITAALLTGNVGTRERSRMLRALHRGDVAVAFGTHALIQEGVSIPRLGLAIIDEQHRFGVFDRARLIALGSQANVLLMTATPIPRSLALTLFRSLRVSSLDEQPPGRLEITTQVFTDKSLATVDAMVRAELEQGRRAYYVLPLIEGEQDDPDSVLATSRRLSSGPFRQFAVGVLHGRMRPAEKDHVMREFRDGALQVLVSTTVIEVGIDVPEATIIVIIAAERYGLAQLHQLRGRVGRGADASRCCLMLSEQAGAQARSRIARLAGCRNGADVAQLDLQMRGPGDLFGARQTGALPLRFAGFIRDVAMLEQASKMADKWLRHDPELASASSSGARAALTQMMSMGFSLGDVG